MQQIIIGAAIGWAVSQTLNTGVKKLKAHRAAKKERLRKEREGTGYSGRTFEHKGSARA